MKPIYKSFSASSLALVFALQLSLPVKAEIQLDNNATPGDPPMFASAPTAASRLAFNPDAVMMADAGGAINLEDLGFKKSDTQNDADLQKLLDKRSKMLKIHQILGLTTGVAMALALSQASGAGAKGEAGKDAREDHAKMGIATGVLYFTTASFSIFAPKVPGKKPTGRTKLHRALAYIHFPGMLATMYLGITDKKKLDKGEDPSGLKPAVATVTAVAFYTSLAVMVIPFGGDK